MIRSGIHNVARILPASYPCFGGAGDNAPRVTAEYEYSIRAVHSSGASSVKSVNGNRWGGRTKLKNRRLGIYIGRPLKSVKYLYQIWGIDSFPPRPDPSTGVFRAQIKNGDSQLLRLFIAYAPIRKDCIEYIYSIYIFRKC